MKDGQSVKIWAEDAELLHQHPKRQPGNIPEEGKKQKAAKEGNDREREIVANRARSTIELTLRIDIDRIFLF